ncbi:argininosuccinate synthase [Candidatus Manganitrophus noduliformans]|uniref:Argininosuccinate synthase n=1 Tax=Candidatus Manganitrophus noduliformans TaxID=2606439 RepID=A0A7X6DNU3_9BACT|nr:argininosuccinate synthase [Candidatus Manganitrophus noduliformans]NKE70532.1 argininosuccinate synthase [Candidatus Manganitrophus noduliformans]
MEKKIKKVVLAYSGGLDTSVIIRWLIERYQCEVIAFCADVGQGEELAAVAEKAKKTGASKVVITDLKEIFAKEYLFPMLRANAVYEGSYLLGTSIARPLIAKGQMEVAKKEKADAVSHGATGKGNDQVRFELTYLSIDPSIQIIAPWRDWEFKSRSELIAYSHQHGIPVTATLEKPYSIDRNLFHVSYEGGILEDPWAEPPESMFTFTTSPQKAPDEPHYLQIGFVDGNPVSIDGKKYSPAKLIGELNRIGGEHGVGRVDLVENRYVGIKSRGVYETPGGTLLHAAHRAIESLTLDREVLHLRDSLIPQYARLVYYGYWFSPERELLQRLIDGAQEGVTGTARLKLYKGSVTVAGRKSPRSLYRQEISTFEKDTVYIPKDAEGFIRLNALRLKLMATGRKSSKGPHGKKK